MWEVDYMHGMILQVVASHCLSLIIPCYSRSNTWLISSQNKIISVDGTTDIIYVCVHAFFTSIFGLLHTELVSNQCSTPYSNRLSAISNKLVLILVILINHSIYFHPSLLGCFQPLVRICEGTLIVSMKWFCHPTFKNLNWIWNFNLCSAS